MNFECPECWGAGRETGWTPSRGGRHVYRSRKCPVCKGTGQVDRRVVARYEAARERWLADRVGQVGD
jgi:DnaJ-class molecular chaperone